MNKRKKEVECLKETKQMMDFNSENIARDANNPTDLTSLHSDCLELIFEHLEWVDLLNVADTSKIFATALCQVFKRKYDSKNVKFDNEAWLSRSTADGFRCFHCNHIECTSEDHYKKKVPTLFARNPGLVLKHIRHFGHLISELSINHNYYNRPAIREIEFYIAEYCEASLLKLTVMSYTNPFESLHKPLKGVKTLNIGLRFNKDCQHMQYINEKLPNLQHLMIGVRAFGFHNWTEILHFDNVEYFTLSARKYPHTRGKPENNHYLPFCMPKLKHFRCEGESLDINDDLFEFVSRSKCLLTFDTVWMNVTEINRTMKSLVDLENFCLNIQEINIPISFYLSPETLNLYLKQCQSLKKFSVHIPPGYMYEKQPEKCSSTLNVLISHLPNGWKYNITNYKSLQYENLMRCHVFERID